jgi:ankyrin repeat protein
LLDLKSDINLQDKNGETALHLACKHGHTKAAAVLLEYDADTSLVSIFHKNSFEMQNYWENFNWF